jgi:hypothetical protein
VAQRHSAVLTQRGRPKPESDELLGQLRREEMLSLEPRPRFGVQAAAGLPGAQATEGHGARPPGSVQLQARALEAALAAWKQAYKSPSVHGLPSVAGVNAYRRVLSEREPIIRNRLRAALALLRYRSERIN